MYTLGSSSSNISFIGLKRRVLCLGTSVNTKTTSRDPYTSTKDINL